MPDEIVEIRDMVESDLPGVMEIENDVFTDSWPESVFREDLCSEFSQPYVAHIDNAIVGYAVLWQGVDEGHLTNIAVSRNYQRKSIAKKLLSFILRIALADGLAQIILEVRPSNTAAIALYHKFGFENLALRKNYYTSPREDCLMMVKPLSGDTDFIGD